MPGIYIMNQREVRVEWMHGTGDEKGYLVVVDGPLRQPFSRYIEGSEEDAEYTENGLLQSSLLQLPLEQRLSFPEQGKVSNRLEAMKIAKQQAAMRERAAQQSNGLSSSPLMRW